jgi:hypothetical protein
MKPQYIAKTVLLILMVTVPLIAFSRIQVEPELQKQYYTSDFDTPPYDRAKKIEPLFWWDLDVYKDTGSMHMKGVSTIFNPIGSQAFIYLGVAVQVDELSKVKIGIYAKLTAKIATQYPGSVWIDVSVVLCNENMNEIDEHRIFKRRRANGNQWNDSLILTTDMYKLDSETSLQPDHTYYVCARLEGWLCYISSITSISGIVYAKLEVYGIMWEFY